MGLATIDSHRQKELTEIHKIPKFGVKMSKFTKKCMAIQTLSDTASGCHTFLCKF